jgi:NADH-quinone oxidoreductase subunit E
MTVDAVSTLLEQHPRHRSELIPVLQRFQGSYGFISPEAVKYIANWLHITENDIYGVATFYAQFRFTPPGRHHLRICCGTACHVKGGEQILQTVKIKLDLEPGQTSPDGEYDLERVACLGCCALAPVVTLDDKTYAQMSVLKIQRLLDDHSDNVQE